MNDVRRAPSHSRVRGLLTLLTLFGLSAARAAESTDQGPSHAIVPGFERFYTDPKADLTKGGALLLGELNCTSCHQAEKAAADRIDRKQAPMLDSVGSRVRPEYLRAFLADPQSVKPGTTMPNVVAGLSDAERKETVEALVHFLATTGGLTESHPNPRQVVSGRTLFAQVGCIACHGPVEGNADRLPTSMPLGDLARKYTIPSLTAFLLDPHKVRPSGRMPALMLNPNEASDLAHYLLRKSLVELPPNMTYRYYEGSWQEMPDFKEIKPVETGTSAGFDLSKARRNGEFAFRFEGFLRVDRDGDYRFWLSSDDGSRLFIDDRLVVDNGSIHPRSTKEGSTHLTKGVHPIAVEFFQGGGEAELELDFAGPRLRRQPINYAIQLTKEGPSADESAKKNRADRFVLDTSLAEKGRALFAKIGCASCHTFREDNKAIASTLDAKPLARLSTESGCLATDPTKESPRYALSDVQRSALVAALKTLAEPPAQPPSARGTIARTLAAFNCYACHQRDGLGGVEPARNASFETKQKEMGDEGRIPPNLDGVGAKLTEPWLNHIFADGANDRPYMLTRMPRFGRENVGHLVQAFRELDHVEPVPPIDFGLPERKVKSTGRFLAGGQALGCIKCHNFKGIQAEGVQSIDMTIMTRRLNRDWFHRYLVDPQVYRSGTRMPAAWPGGKTMLPQVLDGDTRKQIEAIWAFLADGDQAAEPYGLGRDPIPLVPVTEAILYRNFILDAGPRAIGVGYPEKVSLAFDANDLRLALIWQGHFMDASRHWTGRGEGYQPPLGDNVLKLPAGPSFATLSKTDISWPKESARQRGDHFRGYRLTKDQRPTFLYDIGQVHVEDMPVAVPGKDVGTLKRTLTLTSGTAPSDLFFRAMVADKIVPNPDGSYTINNELKLRLSGPAKPIVRPSEGKTELLLPIPFSNGKVTLEEEFTW